MTADIVLWLAQDGITNGAIYALLALALLLVFAVTRVIFVPQGEFVSYGALSLALLQAGQVPGVVYVLVGGGVIAAAVRSRGRRCATGRRGACRSCSLGYVLLPCAMAALAWWAAPRKLDLVLAGADRRSALVVPLGPILYRVAFQPLANASVLVLLIASVAVHYVLQGLGLVFFGAEGLAHGGFSDARFTLGVDRRRARRASVIVRERRVLIVALWLFFGRTLYGKALRATAINRIGARLVGIRTELAGRPEPSARRVHRRALRHADRADHHDLLRHRLPDRAQGLRRRHHRRPGQLSAGGGRRAPASACSKPSPRSGPARYKEVIVFTLIIPVLIWLSLALAPRRGGRGGMIAGARRRRRLSSPSSPRRRCSCREFYVTLLNYIGLYSWSRSASCC